MVSVPFRASIKWELTNYNQDYFSSDCTVSLAMLVTLEKSYLHFTSQRPIWFHLDKKLIFYTTV